MAAPLPLPPVPLSDDEVDQLASWLEVRSPFDLQGVIGLFHALAVTPNLVPPSEWLAAVVPNGVVDLPKREGMAFVGMLIRLHGDVLDAVNTDQAMLPDPRDADECASFAAGYVAGVELDPEWVADAARLKLAAPFAYLAGRRDLVSREMLEKIERGGGLDVEQTTRHSLAALFDTTQESFKEARGALARATARSSARAGRNDPCPCGSGKKYKRCCIR